jgi:hypothetical protein
MKILLAPADAVLNHLENGLELLLAKVVDPTWAAKLANLDPATPLDETVTQPLTLSFEESAPGYPVKLKGPPGLSLVLSGEASASISVLPVWPLSPGASLPDPLPAFAERGLVPAAGPAPGSYWLMLDIGGAGLATIAGSVPVTGLLNASYGIEKKGRVRLLRLLPVAADEPIRSALTRLFTSLRWPTSLPQPALTRPAAHFVECLGDLKLSVGAKAGYEWTGVETITAGELPVAVSGRAAASLSVNFACTVAGSFQVAMTAGQRDGWLRVRVDRGSSRGASFGLGIDISAETRASDIPETPFTALGAALGLDSTSALRWLGLIDQASTPADLLALGRTALGEAAGRVLADASAAASELIGGASAFQTLQTHLHAFQKQLATLPAHAATLLVDSLHARPELRQKLQTLAQKLSAPSVQRTLEDHDLELLWKLGVEHLHEALTNQTQVAEILGWIQQLDTVSSAQIQPELETWFAEIKARSDVSAALDLLETLQDPDDLIDLARSPLLGLLETLVGTKLDGLGQTARQKAHAKLAPLAAQLLQFKTKAAEALALAREAKITASVAASFAAKRSREALIDLEFNLASSEARELFAAALEGDFHQVQKHLAAPPADPAARDVVLHGCALETVRQRDTTVTLAFLGWSTASSSSLVQSLRSELVETHEGVVCVETATARRVRTVTTTARDSVEILRADLFIRRLARVTPAGVRTLEAFDFGLELLRSRKPADADDIERLLALAARLDLVPDTRAYARRLIEDFGDPLGEFSATCTVAYEPDALRKALLAASETDIARIVIRTVRAYACDKHAGSLRFPRDDAQRYLDYDYFDGRAPSLPASPAEAKKLRAELADEFQLVHRGRGGRRPTTRAFRNTKLAWFLAEVDLLEIIAELRRLLADAEKTASAPASSALTALVARLLSIRAPFLDFYASNVVFLILDQITLHALPAARAGRTSLKIKLKAHTADETAERFLVA